MVNQKRIALFVDIDNMPLNKKHVDNIISQVEKSGEIVYAKIYGVTDRRHREIICDAVARGFDIIPPVYPTRRGSTKVFDIRILADLCELVATNKTIDGVAIVANPAHHVYLFSKLKRNGIKIFACDNLDEDSAKFVDEILTFGYNDPNSVSKTKKAPKEDADAPQVQDVDKVIEQPVEEVAQEVVEEVAVVEQPVEQPEQTDPVDEQPVLAVEESVEVADEQVEEQVEVEQQEVEPEQIQEEPRQEQQVEEQPVEEEVVVEVVEEEPQQQEDNLDILRQIQQMKQDAPSSDDEEDEALIEKIKQLLDEFN